MTTAGTSRLPGLVRDWRATLGIIVVLAATVTALFASSLAPYSPTALVAGNLEPPSPDHLLGTDHLGRDLLSRLIAGSRTSMLFGLGAALISLTIGVFLGLLAGYLGGFIDLVISRLIELALVVPRLFLILVAVALFGNQLYISVAIVGLTIWPDTARLMRAQVLSLREHQFIEAARASGIGSFRMMFRHLLPNAMGPIIPNTTLQVGYAVLLEASLGFLGLGDPMRPGWGSMLRDAQVHLHTAWWFALYPGLFLAVLITGFMFAGDGVDRHLSRQS